MWSDIFYPDNPKRREQLVRKNQELKDLMENNFRATNQLIDVMNTHLTCSFEHIAINDSDSLKQNCQVMIDCMDKIQAVVVKIDEKLKKMLDPALYEQLKKQNLCLSPEDFKNVSKAIKAVCGVEGLLSCSVVVLLIVSGEILAGITCSYILIGAGAVGCIGLAVVFMGIDMIVEAYLGYREREKLEKDLKEYDAALDQFKEPSEKYQDHITYVKIKIEEIEEIKK